MKKDIAISVVVTCYNEEKTIKESLESALKQNADCRFEVVVVDDKSKDSSPRVIKELMMEYENLSFVQHHKNLGQACAGNVGAAAARGKYIVRLDGDDVFLPGTIQALWEKHIDERADVVIGSYLKRDIETGKVEIMKVSEGRITDLVMCGNLIPKEAFFKTGGIKQILFEEYDLYLNLKKICKKWAYTGMPLYEYRQYPNMVCRQPDYFIKATKELLKFWDRNALMENGFSEWLELID